MVEAAARGRHAGSRLVDEPDPDVLRVAVAIQSGDPEAYSMARRADRRRSRERTTRFITDEQLTLWGIAQLQHGDVAGAVETLAGGRARRRRTAVPRRPPTSRSPLRSSPPTGRRKRSRSARRRMSSS